MTKKRLATKHISRTVTREWHENSPLLVYQHSNMTTIYFSIFGLFFFYSSLLWELRDNGVVKYMQF